MTTWSTHCHPANLLLIALGTVIGLSLPMSPTAKASPSTDMLAQVQALLEKDHDKAALALLNELIRKDPKNTQAYCERAFAYRKLGENEKSLTDADKAVILSPKQTRPLVERGHTYIHLHQNSKAIDDFTSAIKIDPQNIDAYKFRQGVYGSIGQYNKQIDDISTEIKIRPKFAGLFEQRAQCHLALGQLQKAIEDSAVATRLDPSLSEAYNTAARAQRSLGFYDNALALQTTYLKLNPKSAYGWGDKAELQEFAGKHDLTQADWLKAFSLATPEEKIQLQLCSPLTDANKLSAERPKNGIDTQLKAAPVVLPFHYDEGGHICVPAQINGQSIEMMLDTGCGHCDVWKDKLAGIATTEKTLLHNTDAQGRELSHAWFRARSLKLGHVTIPNVAMAVQDGLPGHKTLSGFLGGNILENFVVSVDYANKLVILARSITPDKSKNAVVVPMWLDTHCPHCMVTLDGKVDVAALLDTGSPSSMAPDSFLQPLLSKPLKFNQHAGGPWLGALRVEDIRLNKISIGELNLDKPIFEVFPAHETPAAAYSIILGDSFLSRFRTVTFDYPGRRIIFQPYEFAYMSASQWFCEGKLRHAQNEQQSAIDAYSNCMAADADYAPICLANKATAHTQLKEYRKAIEDINKAIKLDPKDYWPYYMRACIYETFAEYKLAIDSYTEAIRLKPSYPEPYRNRARVYKMLGMQELAQKDLKTAERLESTENKR